jgi:hypothetical protein
VRRIDDINDVLAEIRVEISRNERAAVESTPPNEEKLATDFRYHPICVVFSPQFFFASDVDHLLSIQAIYLYRMV